MEQIVIKDVLARNWTRRALEGEVDRLRRSLAKEMPGSDIHRLRLGEINYLNTLKEAITDETPIAAVRK